MPDLKGGVIFVWQMRLRNWKSLLFLSVKWRNCLSKWDERKKLLALLLLIVCGFQTCDLSVTSWSLSASSVKKKKGDYLTAASFPSSILRMSLQFHILHSSHTRSIVPGASSYKRGDFIAWSRLAGLFLKRGRQAFVSRPHKGPLSRTRVHTASNNWSETLADR